MTTRAKILTPWTGTGKKNDPYRPLLLDDYPQIQSHADVTGHLAANIAPSPNLHVVDVTVDDTALANIQADPKYAGSVLSTTANETDKHTQAELTAIAQKINHAEATALLGTTPTKTRRQVTQDITTWLKG